MKFLHFFFQEKFFEETFLREFQVKVRTTTKGSEDEPNLGFRTQLSNGQAMNREELRV